MQGEGTNVPFADTTVADYLNELRSNYEKQIHKLKIAVIDYQNKYLEIKERYDLLIYKRFVRSAEQIPIDEKQGQLFTEDEGKAETGTQEELIEVKSHSRNKKGRKPLNPDLKRVEKIIDIPEEEKTCACGAELTRIGEETSERLVIIPQQMYVEKTIRPKYACRHCEGTEDEDTPAVRIAPVEPSMIPKSIATPSLLSWILIAKFEDHLPYYRQEGQFARIGVQLSRQDMSNWQQQVYQKLHPLFDLLKDVVKSGPLIQMDETPVQVMGEEGRADTLQSRMWLARGGPAGKKVVWYEYHDTRGAYHAVEFLTGYVGYLQTDGYEGYDAAVKGNSDIIHVGCFAHARRKFFEASKISETPRSAEEGIKHIRKLYNVEDKLRSENLDNEKFVEQRKTEAAPILAEFKAWLLKRKPEVPPTRLLGIAINYTLDQWDKLVAYLESPYLTPDNNACERAIRPFVMGRKAWLFCGSPEGAKSSCGIYTLIETAKQNDIVPAHYLTVLFEKAPLASSPKDWEKLLPWNIFTP
ncbi:MAG: IS66 family transposase [Treponema sp.]|nr:IS66 family transposase [Treponema sp.]